MYNIEIKQGTTFNLSLKWETEATPENPSTPVNIDGCKIYMQFRKQHSSPVVEMEASTEDGRITVADGTINIKVPASVTEDLKAQKGVYDLEVHYPDSGDVYRILEGAWTLSPEVTRGV